MLSIFIFKDKFITYNENELIFEIVLLSDRVMT